MVQDILVARDFSPSSERALAHAFDLAERADATLHMVGVKVLHRDPFTEAETPTTPFDKLREWFKERSRETVTNRGFDPGSVRIKHAIMREEAPGPAIVKYAEDSDVDLIALGTHGRRGIRRMLLGSVTEEVLRTAPCPVLATQSPEDEEIDEPNVQQLIVPIDFSDASRKAMRYAYRAIAPIYDASIHLLHVIEEQVTPSEYELAADHPKPADIEVRAESAVQSWAEEVTSEGHKASASVHSGRPEEVITDEADEESSMIVMATQGRTGWRRTMMGSVAEGVVRAASCPVLAATSFPEE